MADAFDPQPPQALRLFYGRFAPRFAAPGVCLSGYRLRWMAFRSADLERGVERAVLDLGWGEEGVTRQSRFVALAGETAGAGCGLTFVEVGLKPSPRCGAHGVQASTRLMLGISMWRSGHPCGLLGGIVLDAQGRPVGAARQPLPLLRMAG